MYYAIDQGMSYLLKIGQCPIRKNKIQKINLPINGSMSTGSSHSRV